MDTLQILNDTLINHLTLQNDTIVHKVLTIKNDTNGFFKMDNPLWYVLTLFLGAVFTYVFTSKQKKNEAVTEARKVFLNKRIEINEQLLVIFSKCFVSTNPTSTSKQVYYKIFHTANDMNDWFDKLFNYANENKLFLSKKVNFNLNLLNNLRKHLHFLITNNSMTDIQLMNFAIKYNSEFSTIFKNTEKSIVNFFEEEMTLEYNYEKLTDKDYKSVQKKLYSYRMISDNFTKGQII